MNPPKKTATHLKPSNGAKAPKSILLIRKGWREAAKQLALEPEESWLKEFRGVKNEFDETGWEW